MKEERGRGDGKNVKKEVQQMERTKMTRRGKTADMTTRMIQNLGADHS